MAKKSDKKSIYQSANKFGESGTSIFPDKTLVAYKAFVLFAFCVLVLMSPYYRGLYFDYELSVFQAVMAGIFILFAIYLYLSKEGFLINSKLELILLLFMVAYIVPYFFAANRRLALGEFFKYAFYFAVFYVASRISKGKAEKLAILNTLFLSTVGVAFFGYQAAVKLIPETARPLGMAMNGLWVGNMINSTLQYHNTAGTVLAFGFIISLMLAMYSRNKLLKSSYFAFSSFIFTAFFFTYSRGSYITLLLALLVFFLLLPREKRISLIFNIAIVGAFVIAFLNKVGANLNEHGKVKLWLVLLIQMLLVFVLTYAFGFVERRLYGISNNIYLVVAGVVGILAIIGFAVALRMHLIPSDMVEKIKSIAMFWKERNFVERMVFYKDGLKIFLKSPLFGYGGGAWVSLYFMYQSYLYFTTQSHNYFLQVLLDTGIVGFSILLVFLWLLFSASIKAWDKKEQKENVIIAGLVAAAVQLYSHSVLDFDFSLASVQVLLFAALGVLASTSSQILQKHNQEKVIYTSRKANFVPVLLTIFYLFVIIISLNFRLGNYYANIGQQALQAGNLSAAYSFLSKAVTYDSLNSNALSDYAVALYRIGDQNKDVNLIAKADGYFRQAIVNDRFNAKIRFKYAVYLLSHGAIDSGLSQIEEGIKLQPLQPANYELKADAYAKVGDYYLGKGDKEKAKKYYEVVLKIPQEIERVKKERERIPPVLKGKENINVFIMTARTQEILNIVKSKFKDL
ncbi:O-antigen polymerase [Caldicellulosiruptor kronotskyensis 2002]|uniref:O-antigen polymerase n=1 Tax=Caldicellulosiruptor kronotskyensis (strain DSM 18902 / VKM B-2412 / 2002) TaxID=632348 RepID=E4SCA5_CALK2|nr:O-antigen ligase family protein [Caldicellulosiruptor kronotskyensis]ADQ44960.1 O-antigen polymerase [Caldicellulosiruptor kronotskyensis 2002]